MKKIYGLITGAVALSSLMYADVTATVQCTPISPVFNYDAGDVQKAISIQNMTSNVVVCTPVIFTSPDFVNPNYSLVNSLMVFPKQFQLQPNQTGSFKLYIYNVQNLSSEGEYDAVMRVDTRTLNAPAQAQTTGATFQIVQQGVVELFKGKLIQNFSLKNLKMVANPIVSGSATASKPSITISGVASNTGNVHIPYQISYVAFDATGKQVTTGQYSDNTVRTTDQPFNFIVTGANITKVSLAVTTQDITTKKYGSPVNYTVTI